MPAPDRSSVRCSTPAPFLVLGILFLLAPGAVQGKAGRAAFWYWGTSIMPLKFDRLMNLDLEDVFLKCGDVIEVKGQYQWRPLVIPDGYARAGKGPALHLVIPFVFSSPVRKEEFIPLLKQIISESEKNLAQHGMRLSGIQLDLEGRISPEEYSSLMEGLCLDRKRYKVSGCFYPRAFSGDAGKEMKRLLSCFDFISVMFYDYQYDFDDFRLTDSGWINSELRSIRALDIPFYIGLPLYGVISVFDREKKLLYQQVDLPDHSVFQSSVFRPAGENSSVLSKFRLEENFSYKYLHFKKGAYFILFSPDREYVLDLAGGIRPGRGNFLGYSFFSYPLTEKYNIGEKDISPLVKGILKRR